MPFQLPGEHTAVRPFGRLELVTHCHLCPIRYAFTPERSEAREDEVSCLITQRDNDVPTLRRDKLVNLHQAGIEPAQLTAAIAMRHALTIMQRPYIRPQNFDNNRQPHDLGSFTFMHKIKSCNLDCH